MNTLTLIFFISALIQLPCSFFVLWAIHRYRKQKEKDRERAEMIMRIVNQQATKQADNHVSEQQETNYLQ